MDRQVLTPKASAGPADHLVKLCPLLLTTVIVGSIWMEVVDPPEFNPRVRSGRNPLLSFLPRPAK